MEQKIRKILFIIILISLLFLTRLVDFKMISHLWNLEQKFLNEIVNTDRSQMKKRSVYFSFIGYSDYESAKRQLLNYSNERNEKLVIISYYNFLHPVIYLANNKGKETQIYLPLPVGLEARTITEIYYYKFDIAKIKIGNKTRFMIDQVGGSFLQPIKVMFEKKTISESTIFEESKYINKAPMIYFFFPLILILLISFFYKKSILISFYYFFIMLFLFLSPSFWHNPILNFIKILHNNSIPKFVFMISIVIQIIIYYLFFKAIRYGRKYIRDKGISFLEKLIISYFLLLPIFLRF